MRAAIRTFTDRLLGRGDAAITVPIFDGALKPNQFLEASRTVAQFNDPQDLATDGRALFVAHGNLVSRVDADGGVSRYREFDRAVSALAISSTGAMAVALGGEEVIVFEDNAARARWQEAGGTRFVCVNALCWRADGTLLATEGSLAHGPSRWCHDLMQLGRSGRAIALGPGPTEARVLQSGMAYAFGATEVNGQSWVCESWKHRIVELGAGRHPRIVLDNLPGYPSRVTAASGGGFWLTVFACRTQLVEFVLREPRFRRRMVEEIDPRYWVAPALSSGHSFLEPLQGAGVKQMGILKPWAPPRSYGLIIRLDPQGLPRYSLHSRIDGHHHGVVAAAEVRGRLYAISRGSGCLICVEDDPFAGEAP